MRMPRTWFHTDPERCEQACWASDPIAASIRPAALYFTHFIGWAGLLTMPKVLRVSACMGLAPGGDPIGTCRSLGVTMEPKSQGKNTSENGTSENTENGKTESNGGEKGLPGFSPVPRAVDA